MSDKSPLYNDTNGSELKQLAIEDQLPLKTVGIENLKEANPQHMPPHRYIHPWFARRPTPASRLAILASILPADTDSDKLLQWMQIGPDNRDSGIAKYVEKKKQTEGEREGTLGEHYGYPRPFTNSPSAEERQELHDQLRDFWDGELPTVLDPTAGGGVIPFESLRYHLPTVANELNPIPWLMLELMLEQAPAVGSLSEELEKWGERINEAAAERLEEYFPSAAPGQTPSHYAGTYLVTCPDCGADIPLVKKWWLKKKSTSKGIAARPHISENGEVSYSCVKLPDQVKKSEFNPQEGPKSRSGAECLRCGVVMEDDKVQESLVQGEFEYEIYGVKYTKQQGGSGWRAPTSKDRDELEKAVDRVESDIDLYSLLQVERYIGDEDRAGPYGVTQWRDAFTPRQLITHYEYLSAFKVHEEKIRSKYEKQTADAILTILSLVASKLVDRNSRFSPLDTSKGYPGDALGGKHFTLQWAYVENNLASGNQNYHSVLDRVSDSYEEIVSYLDGVDADRSRVLNGDAADLDVESNSLQAVVIDPPYYDSIIYSELSDMCYVWLQEYLSDTYPFLFEGDLSEKGDEAVANVKKFENIASGSQSKRELAEREYESKMAAIFDELHRVLEPGGVMTVMFTHKEASAWDTLTMALIKSGFTVTSTHPITSEMPQRTDTRGGGSADSTLLLTGRKPIEKENKQEREPTLWSDVKDETQDVAQGAARNLLTSGLSLTRTDIIISAFGPTLRVFADNYPVVDAQGNEIKPRKALEVAREAVTRVLVDEYLTLSETEIESLDNITEWYVLSWLIYGTDTFPYDEGYQLGLGVGVDIDDVKRSTKLWRKKRGDIKLRGHEGRVQNINKEKSNRSSRKPISPDSLSFNSALDKVHAALYVYEAQGASSAWEWLKERNCRSDKMFKSTLISLLQVLPRDHEDWQLARDLSVGDTGEYLDLDLSQDIFQENDDDSEDENDRQGSLTDFKHQIDNNE